MCARLEKILRDFLWGGGALEKKPHLVNWSLVCADMRARRLRYSQSCGPKQSLTYEVELEICGREGFSVETSHHRQIWGRGRRLVFERSEGRL